MVFYFLSCEVCLSLFLSINHVWPWLTDVLCQGGRAEVTREFPWISIVASVLEFRVESELTGII